MSVRILSQVLRRGPCDSYNSEPLLQVAHMGYL